MKIKKCRNIGTSYLIQNDSEQIHKNETRNHADFIARNRINTNFEK